MSAVDAEPFPRGALIAVAVLLTLTIAGTAAVRLERLASPPPAAPSGARPWDTEDLWFIDGADGSVVVRDSHSGRLVATLPPGTGGFVRGVMRGLARDRRARGVGERPPFRLSEWEGGRLTLEDTATGGRIDLEAFGSSNRDAFLRLLHPRDTAS